MDLQKLLMWLQWQMANDEQRQAVLAARAKQMNQSVPRDVDGNIQRQGLGGIYSDSLPFTPTDQFRYKHPGLADILNEYPKPTPPIQQKPYQGWL